VIVAHSQGAEVAHRVLRNRSARAPIAGLVTFGAGIAKLHAVGKLAGARRRSWSAFVLRWGSAACACGAVAVVGGWQDAPNERATAAALLAVAIGLLSLARKILRAIVGDEKDAIGIGGGQVQLWTDLHASHDLVSEGPLRFPDGVVGTTQAIVNGRSMLDHVTYWHNVEGFACAVARELERAADKRPGVGSSPALQDAVRSRTYVIDAMLYTARVAVATLVAWLCWTLEPGVLGVVAILAAAALVLFAVSKLTAAHIARRTDAVIAAHHRAASDRHGTT
jgi:hypothetical protein